jgi:hypothetical protein
MLSGRATTARAADVRTKASFWCHAGLRVVTEYASETRQPNDKNTAPLEFLNQSREIACTFALVPCHHDDLTPSRPHNNKAGVGGGGFPQTQCFIEGLTIEHTSGSSFN